MRGWTLRLILAAFLAGAAPLPSAAQCQDETAPFPVRLIVHGARAIQDPEGCCGGDPELYVKVLVDGALTCTLGPLGSSFALEGPLNCDFTIPPPYASFGVELELWDQDGGLGFNDDHMDLSPAAGPDINFRYDPRCNKLTDDDAAGEIPGCPVGSISDACSGAERTIAGNGDVGEGKGEITFSIGPRDGESPLNGDLTLTGIQIVQVTPNPSAAVHDKATMVRAILSSTHDVPLTVRVDAEAEDEVGNQFLDTRMVDLEACQSGVVVNFYPPGWNGGATWGFRPQAGPETPPTRMTARVEADPEHLIDTCTGCSVECWILNNAEANDRIPVKRMKNLSVLFQPVAQTDACLPDSSGTLADADATRIAATPYMRELIPAQTLTTNVIGEILTLPDEDIFNIPHVSMAQADLLAVLAEGFDRIVGVVKTNYFECHFREDWEMSTGASLGDYGPRLTLAESEVGAISSEVVTHELGHTFGLSDAPCPLAWPESLYNCNDEYRWCPDGAGGMCPTTEGLTTRGFRLSTGVSMDGGACLMGESDTDGGTDPDAWLCDADYAKLIRRLKDEFDPEVLWLRMRFSRGRVGSFFKDDASRIPQGVPDILSENGGGSPDPGQDTTSLVFKDAAGAVLDRVHFTPESADTDGDLRDDSFFVPEGESPQSSVDMALVVALPAGTASIDMVRRECVGGVGEGCDGGAVQGSVTDTLVVPAEPVAVELLHPVSSVRVNPGDLIPIQWRDLPLFTGGEAPAALPHLSYVLVSPDNGGHWIPLAARVPGTRYDWHASTSGRYLVRVFSTNGFQTDDARGESDLDGDGCGNSRDPNPTVPNPDSDGDGVADVCDTCPTRPNPVQQDVDGDGLGDACDNCPGAANPDQQDADKDGHGNACDCAPTDAATWEVPAEASSLAVNKSATGGPSAVALSWSSMAVQAGGSVRYDMLTGGLGSLRASKSFGAASCLANDLTTNSLTTTQSWPPPAAEGGYYYLVRGQNPCGRGTYGNGTPTPDPRDPLDGTASPCP